MQTDPQNLSTKQKSSEIALNCPCKQIPNPKNLFQCSTCKKFQHQECMKDILKMTNYQCPICQLKESDFFIKPIYNIFPAALIKNEKTDIIFKRQFQIDSEFPKFIEKIFTNNSDKINLKYVMIRCLRLDEEGYEHHWPFNCSINLNNNTLKTFSLPKNPPRSKSRMDNPLTFHFRTEDIALNVNKHFLKPEHCFLLGKHMHLTPNKPNSLEIKIDFSKNDNDIYSYVISIDLVEIIRETSDVIKNISVVSDVKTLMSLLAGNQANSEYYFTNEKINLIDCFTNSQRIKNPARSLNCTHLSVFDLGNFLGINRKNKCYQCPICKKKATRVYVDGFIDKYMKDNPNSSEVVLSPKYEIWGQQFIKEQNETTREENEKEKLSKENNSKKITPNKKFRAAINVIDLEDDHNEELKEKSSPMFNNENVVKSQIGSALGLKNLSSDKRNGSNNNSMANNDNDRLIEENSKENNIVSNNSCPKPQKIFQVPHIPNWPTAIMSNPQSNPVLSSPLLSSPITPNSMPSNHVISDTSPSSQINNVTTNTSVATVLPSPNRNNEKLIEENKERDSSGNVSISGSKDISKKTIFKIKRKTNSKVPETSSKLMPNTNQKQSMNMNDFPEELETDETFLKLKNRETALDLVSTQRDFSTNPNILTKYDEIFCKQLEHKRAKFKDNTFFQFLFNNIDS